MIGVILFSHRNLAQEMKAVMEHVVGAKENVESVGIFPNDEME